MHAQRATRDDVGRSSRLHLLAGDTQFGQLFRYGLNGLLTAVVYTIVVWTLVDLSRRTFAFDVLGAYVCAVICNYIGARLIFKPTTDLRAHLVRYLVVIGANFVTTTTLAWLLHRAHAPDVIAAYLPVAVTAVPTFVLLRTWVFKADSAPLAIEPVPST